MNGEKILFSLGKIDDRLVMSATPMPVERKRSPWPMVLTAAAVLMCLLAVPQMVRQFHPDPPIELPPVTDPEAEPEPALSFITVPETAEDFPATVEEALQQGMELKTLEEWGILGNLLPVYGEKSGGSFPYWSADMAMERLQEGYGYCAMEEPVQRPLIYQIGLVYLHLEGTEHTVPYYWFSSELRNGQEGLYFLPAIYDSFLTNTARWRWKADSILTMEEKIMALPDPNNVGEEAKLGFIDFMDYSGEGEKYLHYEMELETVHVDGMGEYAVLRCRGPLMVGRSEQRTFYYDYAQGSVVSSDIATWYSPQTDLAENIRQMLLYRDAEDAGSQQAYDRLVREAFAQYFIENLDLLWYLPEFDAKTSPDRDDLLMFVVLCGGLNTESFTEEELDAAMANLMEGVTFEHGPANNLQLENGVYTYLPYGLPYDPVYYRPEACVWNAQSNTWTLTLSGYAFSEEDFWEDSTEHSANWNALWSYLEQHSDPDTDLSAQPFGSLILPLLYDGEVVPLPEEIGMKASETLTVTFRLQAGDNPLRFVSCHRK